MSLGDWLKKKSVPISGNSSPEVPSLTFKAKIDNISPHINKILTDFNDETVNKEILDNLTDVPESQVWKFFPIIAYKNGRDENGNVLRVRINPELLEYFNTVFATTFTEDDELLYYVCLIRLGVNNNTLWMVRYAFGTDNTNIVLVPVMFDTIEDAIGANSIPHRSFINNEHLDVYLFEPNKQKSISEVVGEIDSWLRDN